MTAIQRTRPPVVLDRSADLSFSARQRLAVQDLRDALRSWRLAATLAWLDIRLRYRGSVLGPLWLTLSTAVMIMALGFLYSVLFKMDLHDYLPFLAVSLILWNFIFILVQESCASFTSVEGTIRAIRMPYMVHAARVVLRNCLTLAHNIIIIVLVFLIFRIWPGWHLLLTLPALVLWTVDCLAVAVLLGALCARFRDIPPIIANIMQIAFFVSPIVWKPELMGESGWWLPLNPFYSVLEIVRAPLLGGVAPDLAWVSAAIYSAVLCVSAWFMFVRSRARLAFWV